MSSGHAHCQKCDRDLEAGEPAYRMRRYVGNGLLGGWRFAMQTMCRTCADIPWPPAPSLRQLLRGPQGPYVLSEWECAQCQRPLYLPRDRTWRRHPFCSGGCAREFYAAAQRNKRAERRPSGQRRNCATCGAPVTTGRADSRFCSSACRQKAYRKRVTAGKSGTRCPIHSRNEAVVSA